MADPPIPLPIRPVEPDLAAMPVAVTIDPVGVLGLGGQLGPEHTIKYAIPPNTLVFRHPDPPRALSRPTAEHKRRMTIPDPIGACAYYVPNTQLIPFGVSIDGNESAEQTRRFPTERGRVTVAVSGTVTLVVHHKDVQNLRVGDRVMVDGVHACGLIGYPGFQLPKIVKFDAWAGCLARFEQDAISAESLIEHTTRLVQLSAEDCTGRTAENDSTKRLAELRKELNAIIEEDRRLAASEADAADGQADDQSGEVAQRIRNLETIRAQRAKLSSDIEGLRSETEALVTKLAQLEAERGARDRESEQIRQALEAIRLTLAAATSVDRPDNHEYNLAHRAHDYFGVVLELGYNEMRVLLTP